MDVFAEFMKLVVRLCVGIGWLIGAGLQNLFLSSAVASTRFRAVGSTLPGKASVMLGILAYFPDFSVS